MFRHVAATCLAAPAVTDVLVVAGDAEAAALALSTGARAIVPDRPGLHAALTAADALLAGASASLVVAADLPLLAVVEVETLVAAAGTARAAVAIAPTRDGGTGGLLRVPADVMPTAFGPGSASAHAVLAAEAGVRAAVLHLDGFARDVDTAGQLAAVAAADPRVARWAG
jgi:2-phospho-L-lactate guanylyltransferase